MADDIKKEEQVKEIANIPNEVIFIGNLINNSDLFVEYGQWIKSKYDFSSDACVFFYDNLYIIYKERTQVLSKENINTFMTEDTSRQKEYHHYGGFKTLNEWANLAKDTEPDKVYEVLKKYSLLREYSRKGIDVQKIMSHKKFEMFSANDIYKLIRNKVDKIQTVINSSKETTILTKGSTDLVNSFLFVPECGIPFPFPDWTTYFRGALTPQLFLMAMPSNLGKSRLMMNIIAYFALVQHEVCYVMLNEMTERQMQICLITTVINNEAFQKLHGIKLNKIEREISLGLYRKTGTEYSDNDFVVRETDANGKFTEKEDEYKARLYRESEEYQKVIAVSDWIEKAGKDKYILCDDVEMSYDNISIESNIRKKYITKGVKYIFYDTLKAHVGKNGIDDWSGFLATATMLAQLAKELNLYIYGSVQLKDCASSTNPLELDNELMASAKQIKTVATTSCLAIEISSSIKDKYGYIPTHTKDGFDWGTQEIQNFPNTYKVYSCVVDKNRAGSKPKLAFAVNLDTNVWIDLGILVRKST